MVRVCELTLAMKDLGKIEHYQTKTIAPKRKTCPYSSDCCVYAVIVKQATLVGVLLSFIK